MKKRGVSQIVTTILLILLALAAIVIVYTIYRQLIREKSGEVDETMVCLFDINLEIDESASCYFDKQPDDSNNPDYIKITIKNKNDFDYGEGQFFVLKAVKDGVTTETLSPTTIGTFSGFAEKEFPVGIDDPSSVEKFIFIPRVKMENQEFFCYSKAIEFKSEKPC